MMKSLEYIENLRERGNDDQLELVRTNRMIPSNFYETVCAFLNSNGGEILFASSFENEIKGLTEMNELDIIKKLKDGLENRYKIQPKIKIKVLPISYNNERLIYINVPSGNNVFTTNNGRAIFERIGPNNVMADTLSEQLKIQEKKRFNFPDKKIIKNLELSHFDFDVYRRAMILIRQTKASHPWLNMDFDEVMKSSGLWREDLETKESGYTLGAVLLFGRDEIINSVIPGFRIDALREKEDDEEYQDRETFCTNLIDTYFGLMGFVKKHLSDIFVLIDSKRVGVRDLIYREVIVNFLIHQDYGSGLPSKFAITHLDGGFTVNSNKVVFNKTIDPNNYNPVPKNPTIGKFLREMGLAEELGFGLKKITKLVSQFTTEKPVFMDGITFFTSIPPMSKRLNTFLDGETSSPPILKTKKNLFLDNPLLTDLQEGVIDQEPNLDFTKEIKSDTKKYIKNDEEDEFDTKNDFHEEKHSSFEVKKEEIKKIDKIEDVFTGVFEDLSDTKQERLRDIVLFLFEVKYSTTANLIKQIGVSRETISREIKVLKEKGIIHFKGALKNGQYYLTDFGIIFANSLKGK
jgi:ATP-dependent DNA helicase RecG